ncbi:MAG: non-heme chloroperoxidase [Actinomycetota bacterium]|nr:non-heme chloroperoxidase [Actinomycetota bacterium]
MSSAPYDDSVVLPGGPRLALRRIDGDRRPFLLVHGLASNARTWDGAARELAEAGHEVISVDQRGHGRSEQTADGYTTEQCAADLARLIEALDLTGDRTPVVAGQSWGGNVVVSLAANHGGVAAIALVDGGWIRLSSGFSTFGECWAALAPPAFEGTRADDLVARLRQWHPDWSDEARAGTLANFEVLPDGTVRPWLRREHHREIVRSLFEGDPSALFPRVQVPVLVAPAMAEPPGESDTAKGSAVDGALALLPDAQVEWYVNADHDLHAQQPARLAGDLRRLADRVEAAR